MTSKVKVFCLNDGKLNDQLRAHVSIIQGETNSDRCTEIIIVKITYNKILLRFQILFCLHSFHSTQLVNKLSVFTIVY